MKQDHAPSDTNTTEQGFRALFSKRRWALVPRQTLFLLAALPLALTVPVAMISLVSIGASLIILGVGFVLLLVAAALGRWFGSLELRRLHRAGAMPIEAPEWPNVSGRPVIEKLRLVLLDRKQWSYIAYTVLYLPLGTVSGSLALVWLASIVNGVTRWFWNDSVISILSDTTILHWVSSVFGGATGFLLGPVTIFLNTVLGIAALVTLPWLAATMVDLHDRLARVFLGRYSPEEIDAQMQGLRRSRKASVAAEGRALRRLERDLHDGPQQQLLRLQLDLAAAQRKLASDPAAAAALIEEAGRRSAETLTELRHLVRGIAPPLLQDRGLIAALEALAERSPIPARLQSNIGSALEIEPAVQQGIYFIVAELLANAIKHSGAKHIVITCALSDDRSTLIVTVTDDGDGGAQVLPGHGLAGIDERVEGLGGHWTLTSPQDGPTSVALYIPI